MGRPKKYHTEEELREARCQKSRKYYNTHREAIFARRAGPAVAGCHEVGQKVTSC
jgi:hypothetical protein